MLADLENKKILFFCPHPDDDVFSAGALIKYLASKNEVYSVFVTYSPRGVDRNIPENKKIQIRKKEAIAACKVLGSEPIFLGLDQLKIEPDKQNIEIMEQLLEKENPDIVFLPPVNDAHPTHKKVNQIVSSALEKNNVKEVWAYETWTPLPNPDYIFFFNDTLMEIKKKAMEKHVSQTERLNFVGSMTSLNRFRGIMGQELMGGFGKSYKEENKYGEAYQKIR
jgi:LmbE family N-acetylglucosaminyl deacetylase